MKNILYFGAHRQNFVLDLDQIPYSTFWILGDSDVTEATRALSLTGCTVISEHPTCPDMIRPGEGTQVKSEIERIILIFRDKIYIKKNVFDKEMSPRFLSQSCNIIMIINF